MAAFTDKLGREWVLDITKGDIRRVEKLGIPFGLLLGDMRRLAKEVLGDPDQFDRVLWCLIEPQAKAASVDRDGFDDGWNGETQEAAGLAFAEAVADFSPALRKVKGELMKTFQALEAKQVEIATARIQEATGLALEAMSESPSTFTSSASNSQPSPEPTATG